MTERKKRVLGITAVVVLLSALIFGISLLGQTEEQKAENTRQLQLSSQYGKCGIQFYHADFASGNYKRLEKEVAHDLSKFRDKDLNVIPLSEWNESDRRAHAALQAKLVSAKGSYNVAVANYNSYMAESNFACSSVEKLPKGESFLYPRNLDFISTN